MEIKMNESTNNRPQGKRLVDAPAVFIDIEDHVQQLQSETGWQKNDRNAITVFKSADTTVVITALHKNAMLDDLDTEGLILVQVLRGSVFFTGDENESRKIAGKQMMAIHPGPKLQVTAEEDSVLLLTVISN